MDYQFRNALNGFHRGDVVAYLQNLTEQHKAELLKQQAELQRLREENQQLKEAGEATQQPPIQAPETPVVAESPALPQQELEAYRRAEAAERNAAARAAQLEQDAEDKVAATRQALESLLSRAAAQSGQATADMSTLIAAAGNNLQAMQQQLSSMRTFLSETTTQLEELQK